jgi:mannose-6-phosphate isomerase-like protein (cupin superfamily)
MEVVKVFDKFELFNQHWTPHVIGELNGQSVKIAKLEGEFVWHHHDHEDELFWVVKGQLKIEFRDKALTINENEFVIVPKGVEHKPVAEKEVWVMLFEPKETLNTGNINSEFTVKNLKKI